MTVLLERTAFEHATYTSKEIFGFQDGKRHIESSRGGGLTPKYRMRDTGTQDFETDKHHTGDTSSIVQVSRACTEARHARAARAFRSVRVQRAGTSEAGAAAKLQQLFIC